jgi:hypothetical protein
VGLKLNGTCQLLVYADGVNLLGDNIDTIKENIETLIDTSKEVGLKVSAEKTKYIVACRPVARQWTVHTQQRNTSCMW